MDIYKKTENALNLFLDEYKTKLKIDIENMSIEQINNLLNAKELWIKQISKKIIMDIRVDIFNKLIEQQNQE